jgi:preprotein translocase subunit YajC
MASLLPLLLLGAMMWLLLIRPQQQRVRKQQSLLQALDVGDEVITAGGMIGRITSMDGDRVSIELAPGTVVEFLRGAVSQRLGEPTGDDHNEDETIVLDDDDR